MSLGSHVTQALTEVPCKHVWCVTGTPFPHQDSSVYGINQLLHIKVMRGNHHAPMYLSHSHVPVSSHVLIFHFVGKICHIQQPFHQLQDHSTHFSPLRGAQATYLRHERPHRGSCGESRDCHGTICHPQSAGTFLECGVGVLSRRESAHHEL